MEQECTTWLRVASCGLQLTYVELPSLLPPCLSRPHPFQQYLSLLYGIPGPNYQEAENNE